MRQGYSPRMQQFDRRKFLTTSGLALGGAGFFSSCGDNAPEPDGKVEVKESPFKISLAQWSMHVALKAGKLDNLDYPKFTQENFGINAVEWVNQFFSVKNTNLGLQPKTKDYITQMKQRCDDLGVRSVLIMCDGVGQIGNPDADKRTATVAGHYAWCDAAKMLGCHSIRVNASSDAKLSPEEQADLCADGLRQLSEFAKPMGLNVIVENHGGLSSNGAWLSGVMKSVNMDNCGTLPDFGNFYVAKNRGDEKKWEAAKAPFLGDPAYSEDETGLGYDRYKGTKELMPFAKGVSAKAHDFDEDGNEIHTDFLKMMQIVEASGYTGYVGIEYEGKELGEVEGIKKTKALLDKTFAAI